MQPLPPEKSTVGKLILSGTTNPLIRAVKELQIGTLGLVPKQRGGGSSSTVLPVRIDPTITRSRGECYGGYIQTPIAGPFTVSSGASGFTAANIGSDGEEVTLLNTQEGDGSNTHSITDSPQKLKIVLAYDLGFVDDGGKRCFLIVAADIGC